MSRLYRDFQWAISTVTLNRVEGHMFIANGQLDEKSIDNKHNRQIFTSNTHNTVLRHIEGHNTSSTYNVCSVLKVKSQGLK